MSWPVFRLFPAALLFLAGAFTGELPAAPSSAAPGSKPKLVPVVTAPVRAVDSVRVRDSLKTVLRRADSLKTVDSLRVAAIAADSARHADSLRAVKRDLHDPAPDSTYRWPANSRVRACADPLETASDCWRQEALWAPQETGFPGIRTGAVDLRSLEPLPVAPFYSGASAASPYRSGGTLPFRRVEGASGLESASRGPEEAWLPVQPLDTPVTDLHWVRGALFLNQFTLRMERMVGNRAYLGLEYHSDGAESEPYQYAFQVHQPYLGPLGRDSLSLVIQDTSHAIQARHIRPRLGFWLSPRDVVEFYADFVTNKTSLTNPTNSGANDSAQLLYPASFGASTFGAVAAHAGETHAFQTLVRHTGWDRTLSPRLTSKTEASSGLEDFARLDWTLPKVAGAPRLRIEAQNAFTENGYYTGPASDTLGPRASARDDRERVEASALPALGPVSFDLRGEGARRARADGRVEWLGGGDAGAALALPLGFELTGNAGRSREGAPDDLLFRRQPALGLFGNPGLTPRTVTSYGAGADWKSKHLGFGAAWDKHRFENTWLPRTLPDAYGSSLPDSLSLMQANYPEETRTLLHLSAYGAVGNWRLSLWATSLLHNAVRDNDTATGPLKNWTLPRNVLKGQLLWKRRVLDDKLGLQTQWDWEWFSERTVYASDMNGTSRPLKLDEYLALDFTAHMEIKTFVLYFRAMNLNHDRYATEPGVHPPGVNFRFGADWRIRN